MELISVKDRLPTVEANYLIYRYTDDPNRGITFNGFDIAPYDFDNGGYWITYRYSIVTHWMPLPDEPEIAEVIESNNARFLIECEDKQ